MKRHIAIAFAIVAAAVPAQSATFRFTNPQTQQSLQEAATILRTVADLPQVSLDAAQSSLTFQGPQTQTDMGQWILLQLSQTGNESATLEYKSPAGDDVVRVNFLANVTGPQPTQELLTVLRTVADIQKIFNFTSRNAVVVRAKSTDIAFAEWIIDQLNLPSSQKPDATPRVYPDVTPHNLVARVNYLTNIPGTRETQQLLTVLRTVGTIAKVFTYTSPHAFVLRASAADMDRAEWLIQELDQPSAPANAGAQTYQTPGADDVTRIFFLTNASEQQLNAALSAIRTETKNNKAFFMGAPAAVVVRGTADQVEAAVETMAHHNGLAMTRTATHGD
jgi:hypothetical protein